MTRRLLARNVLTPDALAMLLTVARAGSLAAAARELGQVPSALTYRVRQIEEALDVLLFDRSSRHARLTPAGTELLREGERVLAELDTIANRVKRIATGWEPELTVAVDCVLSRLTVLELAEAFLALNVPTRLRLREEVLSGTLESLLTGQADLAIGAVIDPGTRAGIDARPLGTLNLVFAVAPHHPLAQAEEPLSDALIQQHRAVAVADTVPRGAGITIGLLSGQDVLTVPNMATKVEAQLRGLGCGFLPEHLAAPYMAAGRLVRRRVARPARVTTLTYAWRHASGRGAPRQALEWWLAQLGSTATRTALMGRHPADPSPLP